MTSDLPLTTGPCAAAAYRRGVDDLVRRRFAEAADAFRRSVTEDPCFALGHAGLAVALAEQEASDDDDDYHEQIAGDIEIDTTHALESADRARSCSRRLSRGERHHVEVVMLALRNRDARASALGREHLQDFPTDLVVRHLLRRWTHDEADDPSRV